MSPGRPCVLLAFLLGSVALSATAQTDLSQLTNSSLEEVANAKIQVSSVSRKEEDLDHAPAAVYVVTREEIAHSTANSIPDLLRTVPGLQVAQITSSTWAISARGFNGAYADKLLVLIDGRTVYSEIYSGVHWDEIDLPLEIIERIEVIRGPGAVVWGANAANGVINIITRPARQTEGAIATGEYSRIAGKVLFGQGGSLGDHAQYRGFLSYIDRQALDTQAGARAFDGNSLVRAGFRLDYQKDQTHTINVFGDLYRGHMRQEVGPFLDLALENQGDENDSIAGGFLQAAWRTTRHNSSTDVQVFYVDSGRGELSSTTSSRTADIEVIHQAPASRRIDLTLGAEARYTHDYVNIDGQTSSSTYNNYLVSGFIDSEIVLMPNTLKLTMGTKVQQGTLAGFQMQPSARLLWVIDDRQSLWFSSSRAVVVPSLQEKNSSLPLNLGSSGGLPIVGNLLGAQTFKPVVVNAFEAGYRKRVSRSLSADLAVFVDNNSRLQTLTSTPATLSLVPTPHLNVDEVYTNGLAGLSEGAEANFVWRPSDRLHFDASYSWAEAQLHVDLPGSTIASSPFATAKHTVTLKGTWTLNRPWSLEGQLYHVGNVAAHNAIVDISGTTVNQVDGYTQLNIGIQRKLGANGILQAGGTNLLQARHLEFGSETSYQIPHYIPRSLYLRASWSF